MGDGSTGRGRRPHVPLSGRPYRPSRRTPFVAYLLVFVMIMASVIVSAGQRGFSWLWVAPYLAAAATVYGYRRERAATNMAQGTLWVFAQAGCALGAMVLIALPAKY